MTRAQGKHREFGINWSVATLILFLDSECQLLSKNYQLNKFFNL